MSDDYPTDDDWELVVRGLRGTTAGLEYERDAFLSILTDLIEEVQHCHSRDGEICLDCSDEYVVWWPCESVAAADRAESRLREVGGERSLPQHRTEAGWPNCATCDGGGCPDCTDPA